uniref:Uncharacterized protein n=1 Tax=Glossina morsitans morsitans TaxID=37546 RepID=A0A1B0G655_GLOMM
MFKFLLALTILAVACATPGVPVGHAVHAVPAVPVVAAHAPVVAAHAAPAVVHQGVHSVHSHVVHHPAPAVKAVVTPVVAKSVVPVVPVHHAGPALVAHH